MSVVTDVPGYSIAANLRWFAAVYLIVIVVLSVAIALAERYQINVPATGLSIGSFIGMVYAAGARFAQKRNHEWTSKDRNVLAFGYTGVSVVISCIMMGALAALDDPSTGSELSALTGQLGGIIAVTMIVVLLLYFAVARFALMMIARRGGSR